MVRWNFNRRCFVSTVAAVPAVASCLFGLSAPALAHARHHAGAHDHHLVRHLVRDQAMPGAPGEYGWAPGQYSWRAPAQSGALDSMAAAAASQAGVPAALVQRVIMRESGGNPRAVSRGNYGLMQIRLGTARAMGYSGSAAGLLDPQTNMTYAVKYLAGAYRAAGGNESRAVALYARGYHAAAPVQAVSAYAPGPGFGAYGAAARQPRGFARDYRVAEATAGPFYNYAVPVHRLRHHRHGAG